MDTIEDPPLPVKGQTWVTDSGALLHCWHSTCWKYSAPADVLMSGYGNRPAVQLVALVESYDCHVADIRLDPRSERLEWSAENLRQLLPGRYVHVPELGNLNHAIAAADIDINNLARGVKIVKAAIKFGHWPLLICACGDGRHCHRAIVASALRADGLTVQEIYNWPVHAPAAKRDMQ